MGKGWDSPGRTWEHLEKKEQNQRRAQRTGTNVHSRTDICLGEIRGLRVGQTQDMSGGGRGSKGGDRQKSGGGRGPGGGGRRKVCLGKARMEGRGAGHVGEV